MNYTSIFGDHSMKKTYILMNKDKPLTEFTLTDIAQDDFALEDVTVLNSSPYEEIKSLKKLLTSRKPAKSREHMDKLLELMQIKCVSGYLDISYGLSLNDTLWVKPKEARESLSWKSLNLYENDFNEVIAHFAFCGQGLAGMHMKTTSPEFGTNGMLPKCWKRIDDKIFLYKGGTSGCSNTGNEPYSEFLASALLEAMKMPNFVKYSLKSYHDTLVSSCELFTTQDYGFVPVCNMFNPELFEEIPGIFDEQGLRSEFNDLMVFDALIWNPDRHLNNYGFIVNNDTYKIEGMAPIFDNGEGLLPYYTMDKDMKEYSSKYDIQNSGLSFEAVLAYCLEERHKKMLSGLVGFKFPDDPLLALPRERIERLENLLQERIQWVLSLPVM